MRDWGPTGPPWSRSPDALSRASPSTTRIRCRSRRIAPSRLALFPTAWVCEPLLSVNQATGSSSSLPEYGLSPPRRHLPLVLRRQAKAGRVEVTGDLCSRMGRRQTAALLRRLQKVTASNHDTSSTGRQAESLPLNLDGLLPITDICPGSRVNADAVRPAQATLCSGVHPIPFVGTTPTSCARRGDHHRLPAHPMRSPAARGLLHHPLLVHRVVSANLDQSQGAFAHHHRLGALDGNGGNDWAFVAVREGTAAVQRAALLLPRPCDQCL